MITILTILTHFLHYFLDQNHKKLLVSPHLERDGAGRKARFTLNAARFYSFDFKIVPETQAFNFMRLCFFVS
jgi:hypothetical protein